MVVGGKGKFKPGKGKRPVATESLGEQQEFWDRPREAQDSGSEEEVEVKQKGVGALIQVENPNHVKQKDMKLSALNDADASSSALSRKEREAVQKQQAKAHYLKMTAEGKTDQARSDLARLAIIKKQRAEAAAKKQAEADAKKGGLKQDSLSANKSIFAQATAKK